MKKPPSTSIAQIEVSSDGLKIVGWNPAKGDHAYDYTNSVGVITNLIQSLQVHFQSISSQAARKETNV